jgi:N-acyl-D-aspartate/D-glutamate deacylase
VDEILIKGGTVVDGTGAPRQSADLRVRDGKIAEIAPGLSSAGRTLDAAGLTVTPGIIDPHTHLDGQLFWAPDGSSSSWHGVTTVLMGNCGYTLAPIKPEDRDYIIHMFAQVEEIAPEIFQNNLAWDWVTFPEYLDAMDKGLGVNVVTMVGHSTLRYYVMGPAALEREATAEEIREMSRILRESVEAGAFGLTTSRAPSHFGWHGEPVPSRQAAPEELIALADTLGQLRATAMGLIPQGLFAGMSTDDKALILTLAKRSGSTIQLNGVGNSDAWEFMRRSAEEGAQIYGVIASQPFYKIFSLNSGTTTFNSMDTWFEIIAQPPAERRRRFADPALRQKLRDEVDAEATMDARHMRRPRIVWDQATVHRVARPENRPLEGLTIPELAGRQGKHKADALIDLALSEDGETQFQFRTMPESAWLSDPGKAPVFNHPNVIPLNSDAGAHIASECKTGESTYWLRRWVLENRVMSLEDGVRKVTADPARRIGLNDRGVLQPGKVADIAIFDLGALDTAPKEPVNDLPGGGLRWVQKASGVEYVLVGGQPTIEHGRDTGNRPAWVLRSGNYRGR